MAEGDLPSHGSECVDEGEHHLSDGPGQTIETGGLPSSVLSKARYFAKFAGLGLHSKAQSSMYAFIAYRCWFRWDRVTGCGSVGRRSRGASVGQGRLEEVFVFGFSGPLAILLNDD